MPNVSPKIADRYSAHHCPPPISGTRRRPKLLIGTVPITALRPSAEHVDGRDSKDKTDSKDNHGSMSDKAAAMTHPMTGKDMVPAIKVLIVDSGISLDSSNECLCSSGSKPDKHNS